LSATATVFDSCEVWWISGAVHADMTGVEGTAGRAIGCRILIYVCASLKTRQKRKRRTIKEGPQKTFNWMGVVCLLDVMIASPKFLDRAKRRLALR
jgi:hypothetical protein